jgi:O-antigen/teichoic acid export membrane protein
MKIIDESVARFNKNNFWRSVTTLVSGTVLAQFIGLLTTPVVSRLYNTKAYGEYGIIISTATIIISIVTLGLSSAVMIPTNDDECDDVFMVTFITSLILSTFILMISVISTFKFFDLGMYNTSFCLLVYIYVVINNLKGLLTVYINRKKLNRVLFYNSLIGALVTLVVTIPLGLLKFGSLGLVMAGIIATVISIIQMIYHVNPFKRLPSMVVFKSVFNKYKDYVLFQYPSNFIGNLAIQLPTQMLSANFGNASLGSYSMCEKLLGIPSRLIGVPINNIYFRTASEYYKEGKNLADFTFSLITKIMLVAFLPIIVIIFWGEPIFAWVLGAGWSKAGKLASILILQYVLMFCQNCTSYCRVAIGKQRVNLVVSLLRLTVVGLSIVIGKYIFGGLLKTIICFSVGSSIYLIIDMAINFYCMKKYWVKYIMFALGYVVIISLLWTLVNVVS